ncbi:MerR family transcriptional regulator [Fructobacillus sp. M1-13]|uniref:MerR family transcriptional regulator n=1 Tax=Fructobacillus papyriferae TaxID=2713171 RepID=A0ABS5QQB9_9LACO|nr:MerR family transcriptional regulator [Fructobacillus papyriferae]MBS9334685.1 MerR family transcriptional regulator [Fructobacillus papyriferae]MCD2158675.1 MerR family transcriptional regulator [Fructobacillus papyriferae]
MEKEKTIKYKIKAVAEKTGLSEHTLRYYEKEGLVVPERTASNIRQYSEDDVNWLLFIEHMRSTDMSIEDLKHFVKLRRYGTEYEEEILDILLRHRQSVEKKLKQFEENLRLLNYKIDMYTGQLKDRDQTLYEYFLEKHHLTEEKKK